MLYFLNQGLIDKIITDSNFRMRLAIVLEVGERSVWNTAKKYKETPYGNSNFTKMAAVKFFESEGYSRENILTEERPA